MEKIFAVFIGGMIGGSARYGINLLFPESTHLVSVTIENLVGSFLLTFITALLLSKKMSGWFNDGVKAGIIGSFTTFSTLFLNVGQLFSKNMLLAIIFLLVNFIFGLLLSELGEQLGNKLC